MDARRVISGTFGEVWLDDNKVAECYGLEARVAVNREDIPLPRQMGMDSKIVSWQGTGTLRLYKVNTRIAQAMEGVLKGGRDVRFTIISKLADPDSFGSERVALKGVSFDEVVLANWEANTPQKDEIPFIFTDYEFLDEIDPK